MERRSKSVSLISCVDITGQTNSNSKLGIVGAPADHLLGFQGVDGARGPRFRKLSKQEIEDYLTSL
jgi:20S proteasome subunit alpha 2